MHATSMLCMKHCLEKYLLGTPGLKILDMGSYDVNGTYRSLLPADVDYTGMDMARGPNVDFVPKDIYNWKELKSDSFDAVLSGQAFEHTEFFWLTAAEMARILKPGGILILIAPNHFPYHSYPVDCWRFEVDGMVAISRWAGLEPLHATAGLLPQNFSPMAPEFFSDAVLVARKPKDWKGTLSTAGYACVPADKVALGNGWIKPTGHFPPSGW